MLIILILNLNSYNNNHIFIIYYVLRIIIHFSMRIHISYLIIFKINVWTKAKQESSFSVESY